MFAVFAVLASGVMASVGSKMVLASSNSVAGLPLTSPWAIAVSGSNNVYYSNFGGAESIDFIGVVPLGGGAASSFVVKGNVQSATLDYMLVKHLAAHNDSNGDTVYAAVYGGPTGISYILSCKSSTCTILNTIKNSGSSKFIPTAVAYSVALGRVFYAVADGNLQQSYIESVNTDGSNVLRYMSQPSGSGVEYPVGLAVDDTNGLLFWANDIGSNKIVQATLATSMSNIGAILTDATQHPQNIAVDTIGQFVYYTDQTSTPNAISRVRYGSGNVNFNMTQITTAASTPTGIALSLSNSQLVWADTGAAQVVAISVSDIGAAPSKKNAATDARALSLVVALCALLAPVAMM